MAGTYQSGEDTQQKFHTSSGAVTECVRAAGWRLREW